MSEDNDFLLSANSSNGIEEAKPGNHVMFFTDNRKLYASMLADLIVADGKDDFVYLAGWWCDVDIPLGDPHATPTPMTLRQVLSLITREKPAIQVSSQELPPPNIPGAQVCAMIWRQKSQIDIMSGLPVFLTSLPVSIFGDPLLSSINTEAVKHIRACSNDSHAILDFNHRLFGSHHQKLLIVKNKNNLIGYVGSTDFNADRIYQIKEKTKNPTSTKGAPLEDVTLRVVGPVTADILKTFVDRWKLHPEGQNHPLRGDGYTPPQTSAGGTTAQIAHTYGKDYPFKGRAVRSAADTILKIVDNAKSYIYFEDQYLIGTAELYNALRKSLNRNLNLNVIAVMAPLDIVSDLPWLAQRRSDFWRPLINLFPTRIKVFEMTNRDQSKSGHGSYLHAKLTLADDKVATVGSVNCSNRSWYHDSEILMTVVGDAGDQDEPRAFAARLRLERWSRHLGLGKKELLNIGDGISKWGRLPFTALVKPWMPLLNPLSLNQNYVYETVLDPK
ncbi:phospholipase D-like domain-containing protein [Paenibacillus alvei]|uniref:Phospholipase D/transphosphatidylase n=1 Tax=Paenibacillus alvei TaxID=44250 RepID=A0A383R455_PAEAL|nr:phospholipase D-like domain-containing protein [Paenibacillus alvei]SYX81728.1 Phospholipase D/transphosphatidylase [Paenibacillus alvei]